MSDPQAQLDVLNKLLGEKSLRSLGDVIDEQLGKDEQELQNLAADVEVLRKRLEDVQNATQETGESKEDLQQKLTQAEADLANAKSNVKESSLLRNDAEDELDDLKKMLKKKQKKAKQSDQAAATLASKIKKLEQKIAEQKEEIDTHEKAVAAAKADKKKCKNEVTRINGLIDAWVPPKPVDTTELQRQLAEATRELVNAKSRYRSRAFAQTRIDLLLLNLDRLETEVFEDTPTDDTDTETFIKSVWDSAKETPDEAVYAHVITANAKQGGDKTTTRKRRSESPPEEEAERESQRAKSLDIGAPVQEAPRPSTGGKRLMTKGGAMSQLLLLSGFSKP
jgi:chromosome segregation ATPase